MCDTKSSDEVSVETEEYDSVTRLGNAVLPVKYKLLLNPDLEAGTFTGDLLLELTVSRPTKDIILNSHNLHVRNARVQSKSTTQSSSADPNSQVSHRVNAVLIQSKRQLLIIRMESELDLGNYSLIISYFGTLGSDAVGIYRTWTGGNLSQSPRYCMATYFEPTYARFAYPCFDEPHFKAKYSVSLVRPSADDYIALSNSSVEVEVADYPVVGMTTVHFTETPPISSYLTCFIVGVFERLEPSPALSGRVQVSVYSRPGLVPSTLPARQLATTFLEFYSNYFQIEYPFPKLDLIGMPDSKLGGMENWGLVTFKEIGLLLPEESSTSDLLTVVRLIAHELSHMWLGNLVTIAWWNDTWLKEGLADFMAYLAGNATHPTWYNEWVFLRGHTFPGLSKDAALSSRPVIQPVSHPDQIREMFDVISYLKGSCLMRMLHDLDASKFRTGLITYLQRMKWREACSADLWACLGESMDLSVDRVMSPWTHQPGYPLLTLTLKGHEYIITQTRYLKASASGPMTKKFTWDVPIKYFTSHNKEVQLIWFHSEKESVSIPFKQTGGWIKLNWHNVGFYRVNYPRSMWMEFAQMLQRDISVLSAEDRCNLMNDAWCLAREGHIDYDVPFSFLKYLSKGKEDNFLVWSIASSHLHQMRRLLAPHLQPQTFQKYLVKLLGPLMSNLNWDTSDSVPYMERKLRVELMETGCLLGFEPVLQRISTMLSDWIDKKKSRPCAEIRGVVHAYGLSVNENEELWEKMWEEYLTLQNPAEVFLYLRSLSSTCSPRLITRLLEEAKKPEVVRPQNFFTLLNLTAKSSVGNQMVWSFIKSEWEYLVKRFTVNDFQLGDTVGFVISQFSSPQQLSEVEEFFAEFPEAGAGASERRHALETIRANISWVERNQPFLEDLFDSA